MKKYIELSAKLKFATVQNEPKQAETKKCNSQPAIYNSRPFVPYYVHNQVGFGKPVIKGRSFIYLGISKMGFSFQVSARVQDSLAQYSQLERLIFDYTPIIFDSWRSRDQNFELERLWNQEGCSLDRFPSDGDHIHGTLTFEHTWTTPIHTLIGGFLEIYGMVSISGTLEL